MNVSLSESTVREHCRENVVGVSPLEVLPGGGVRLVCNSAHGAALIRQKLRGKLIAGEVGRTPAKPPQLGW